jgi:hypothetical protein
MGADTPSAKAATAAPLSTPRAEEATGPHPPRVMGFVDLVLFYVVTGISLRWIATAGSAGPSAIPGASVWLLRPHGRPSRRDIRRYVDKRLARPQP